MSLSTARTSDFATAAEPGSTRSRETLDSIQRPR